MADSEREKELLVRQQARSRTWSVTPDLTGALNSEGYFETANPAWFTVLGWTEAEVESMSIWELLHPDDLERTRGGFELTQIGQPAIKFPNRYRHKNGTYRWLSWVGVPEDGYVYCTGRDITDEVEREQALAAAQAELRRAEIAKAESESLRRLLKDAPSFMCVLRGPEHRFELMNDAYLQLVGHRDMIGLTVLEALPEVEGQGFIEFLDGVYASGEPFVGRGLPLDLQRTPGGPLEKSFVNFVYQPIRDENGAVNGIFVDGSDITDQKQAELALRESEVQVKLALAAADMGVWQCQVIDGRFINLKGDDRAIRLLGGVPGEPATFEMFASRLHPDDRAKLAPASAKALDPEGDGILDLEYRIVGKDGEKDRWVHARAQALASSVGKRIIGTVRDVTQRKESEATQAILSGELQHRIKNTLAMVNAIASQTLKGEDIADRRQAFTARLEALAQAHDLLTTATWQSAPIQTVIETALTPHMNGHERFSIEGTHLELSAKQALSMALTIHELATNAAKYGALSVPGGKVEVQWSLDSTDDAGNPQFLFSWRESGGPAVTEPTRKGFGSRLISRVLAADFQGEVSIDYAPGGVVCVLASPINSVAAGNPALAHT